MISVGSRDGRRGIEQGFSSSNNIKRDMMEESELEEGEACSYHDSNVAHDPNIDPDVTFSYIDEKLHNVLGHFQKDFEGLVSSESLGAKFGIYGSFLPSYRRSPVLTHPRSPPGVQNHHTPDSLSTFPEEGTPNCLAPADVLLSAKHRSTSSLSASSNAFKPPSQTNLCLQNAKAQPIQGESTSRSEVREQRTLKVRIKVGSDKLQGKKNSSIYTGLGLDGSPSSSFDNCGMESRKRSHVLAFDSFESPTQILRMMTSFPLSGGRFLSPLSDDLMHLSKRPIHKQDAPIQPSIEGNQQLSLQDKRNGNEHIGFNFSFKDLDIDTVSCEELVSNALKLPLLSDSYSNKKEDVYCDAAKSKENPKGKVEADKKESVNTSANLYDHLKPVNAKTAEYGDGAVSPTKKELLLSGSKKKTKKGRINGSRKAAVTSAANATQVLKGENISDTNTRYPASGSKTIKLSSEKDINKAKDRYADFFGDLNDQEDEGKDSPGVFRKDRLKASEVVEKDALAYEKASRDRTNSIEGCRNAIIGKKNSLECDGKIMSGVHHSRPSHNAVFPESDRPISDPNLEADPDEWAECDKCRQWRLLPPGVKGDDLPDEWDCSMQTWVPDMNQCGISVEETNRAVRARCQVLPEMSNSLHIPSDTLATRTAAADSLNPTMSYSGDLTDKLKKASKLSAPDNLDRLLSSSKEQHIANGRTLAAIKDTELISEIEFQQQALPIEQEPNDRSKMTKQRPHCHSDGGIPKIPNATSKKAIEQGLPRTSKRRKTKSVQNGDNNLAAFQTHGNEMLDVSSGYEVAADTAREDQVTNSVIGSSRNVKDQINDTSHDAGGRLNCKADPHPAVGLMPNDKPDTGIIAPKKRKGDSFNGCPSLSPSSKKVMDDNEHASSKRKRASKSDGKDTSTTKRNGKTDRKRKNISNQKTSNSEALLKASSGSNLPAASSSSKLSGSLKVISKFQEVKGSPVESVSSSPLKTSRYDKLNLGGKGMVEKDSVPDAAKSVMGCSRKSSDADDAGNGGQSCPARKTAIECGTDFKSQDSSIIDLQSKSIKDLRHKNDFRLDNLGPDSGRPSPSQLSYRCSSKRDKVENNLDFVCGQEKNQTSEFDLQKNENDNQHDNMAIHEERERDRKIEAQVNFECSGAKSEKHAECKEELAHLDRKGQQKYVKNGSTMLDAAESVHLKSISMKHKLRDETCNDSQRYQGNCLTTSSANAQPSDLPKEPVGDKINDVQNGTRHVSSRQSKSNGHRVKNQDATSPHKRESFSQAASSAIKEAKNLKHLADRIKNADSTESTGLYFEAALKFLHGASLLESGSTENGKHGDFAQATQMYSDTAKLCRFCAHEYEKSKDMATAALAYKCMEVAYLRVVYSSQNTASRDRFELQNALQMVPPGESPSSSASDIDNLNNATTVDKAAQLRSFDSPLLAGNIVLAARNRQCFSRLLSYAQDVNSAMEASRKSRIAFAAANFGVNQTGTNESIASIKRALDFNFHDVEGLLRLVRLAKEANSR